MLVGKPLEGWSTKCQQFLGNRNFNRAASGCVVALKASFDGELRAGYQPNDFVAADNVEGFGVCCVVHALNVATFNWSVNSFFGGSVVFYCVRPDNLGKLSATNVSSSAIHSANVW